MVLPTYLYFLNNGLMQDSGQSICHFATCTKLAQIIYSQSQVIDEEDGQTNYTQ